VIETTEEKCPICQRNLSDLPTGFYAVDNIIQKVCIDCIKEKQKRWWKWFIVGLAIGLPLAYILFFVIF